MKTLSVKIEKEFVSLSKKVGAAIGDYDMLHDGDRVVVGFSGGKDSMTLLKLLKYRQTFAPIKFELLAMVIDMGLPGLDIKSLENFLQSEDVLYHIERTDFLREDRTIFDANRFWCSENRRQALFECAHRMGFNKLALGHHQDDIIETILFNLLFRGHLSTMRPKQEFFKDKITIIRPLAYIEGKKITALAKKANYPKLGDDDCPNKSMAKRKMIKDLIRRLERENHAVKTNIFKSVQRVKKDYLLD